MPVPDYALHRLGWKAFQDLCVALVEERLHRPVQTFLPTNDAGRDGAFRGAWDSTGPEESTIQCKFTSKHELNLVPSMLADEIEKAKRLAAQGLAHDYVILTNHTITGQSELKVRQAYEEVGVRKCRVFHRDWIIARIHESARLRMMVPRLYSLVDLTSILDSRAYKQAQLILSEMGDNLKKLVVTEAHRKSVRAISEHSLVLLLGSPAAGKSTIGASLALGANDQWRCSTIKATSPEHLEAHLDPEEKQFFWIDDAWGSTQYQRERTERWNQVFPLMQGAMKRGTRFLITSRDYIWHAARQELKLQALPVLTKSQVIINVHQLTLEEKARILYNHIKLGDQDPDFREHIKPLLPAIAKRDDFLPESARRLGGPRDVFVGALWAIGVFLILYKPEGDRKTWWLSENGWLNVAGFAACLIALVPMNPVGDCGHNPPWSVHSLHGVFAAAFFVAICKVCWSFPADMTKKDWLRRGSKACAGTMAVTIALAFAYYVLVAPVLGIEWKQYFCEFNAVFWFEFFAVYAFGIYWALKSVDENEGLQRLEAVGAVYNEGLRLLPPWFQNLWDWWRRRRFQAGIKAE